MYETDVQNRLNKASKLLCLINLVYSQVFNIYVTMNLRKMIIYNNYNLFIFQNQYSIV